MTALQKSSKCPASHDTRHGTSERILGPYSRESYLEACRFGTSANDRKGAFCTQMESSMCAPQSQKLGASGRDHVARWTLKCHFGAKSWREMTRGLAGVWCTWLGGSVVWLRCSTALLLSASCCSLQPDGRACAARPLAFLLHHRSAPRRASGQAVRLIAMRESTL